MVDVDRLLEERRDLQWARCALEAGLARTADGSHWTADDVDGRALIRRTNDEHGAARVPQRGL